MVRDFISWVGITIGIVAIALALFYKPFRDWSHYSYEGTWHNCVEQPAGHMVCDEGEITFVKKVE